jgi:hypothetical protein
MKSSLLSLQLVANRVLAGVRLLGQVRNTVLFQVRSVVESRPRRRVRTITATPPAHLPVIAGARGGNSARSLRRCGLALYSALLLVVTWARSQRANVTCSYMLTGLRPGPGIRSYSRCGQSSSPVRAVGSGPLPRHHLHTSRCAGARGSTRPGPLEGAV